MRRETKFKILRRGIFAAAVTAVFLLQYTASFVSYSVPFSTGLLLPLTVSVAMAEREYAGLCFGLLAGVLTDTASSVTDGIFTLYYAIIACAAGLLAHYVFRNTVLTAMLFTAASGTAYCLILLFFNCFIHDISYTGMLLKSEYVPSVILSTVLTPAVFYPVVHIRNRMCSADTATHSDSVNIR